MINDANKLPAVDVVILSWDRVVETIEAIDSALSQEGVAVSVFVIDQGTAPAGLALLRNKCIGRSNVKLVCNGKNIGVPRGRNQGASLGTADYIASLDNDAVFLDNNQLARAVAILKSDEMIGALAFRILVFSTGQDDPVCWAYPRNMKDWADKEFLSDKFIGAGHLLRRSCFERVGCYDDRLFFLIEEQDLSYRLLNAGYRILYSPEVVIRHKVGSERRVDWTTDRYFFHVRNMLYLAFKYNLSPTFGVFQLAIFVLSGIKDGRLLITIKAILSAIALLPAALRQRWFDLRCRLTKQGRSAIRAVNGSAGLSAKQRFFQRLTMLRKTSISI